MSLQLDSLDYRIINNSQGGFPLVPRPFEELGKSIGLSEEDTLERVRSLVTRGALSRFGVVLNPRRLGGNSSLVAMAVPPERLEEVIEIVNSKPEVSHNYEREHHFNLWFVVSTADAPGIERALNEIEAETGLAVFNMPMLEEYFIGINFQFPE